VLAIHPLTRELRTAKILTAAVNNSHSENGFQYRAQFDRNDLGVPLIKDIHIIPINAQGANWEYIRKVKSGCSSPNASIDDPEVAASSAKLANEIRN